MARIFQVNSEGLVDRINALEDSELIELHNHYCEEVNDCERMVYAMDDFNDYIEEDPLMITFMVFNGNFNPNDDWWAYDGYGNFVSFGYNMRLRDYICAEDIADEMESDPKAYEEWEELMEGGEE